MANVDRVNGFTPVGRKGGPFTGQVTEYSVAAGYGTALFVGDPVKLSGTASAAGLAEVEQSAAGNNIVGVIVGVKVDEADQATVHPGYSAASTAGTVMVADDPNQVFEVQEDGSIGLVGVGLTCDHTIAAGSTTTGASGAELDSSDAGTGNGWKIIGFSKRADNEPASTNAKILVIPVEHEYNATIAGV
jgi:hypothetical protein